jgi:glucans biosynthesis protein
MLLALNFAKPLTMKRYITRRTFIAGALLTPLVRFLSGVSHADALVTPVFELGLAQPFTFDWLREQAKQLAAQPYQAPVIRHAEVLDKITYDVHRHIHYRPEASLWARGDGPYPVQFFHLAMFFKMPVKLHVVRDGVARELLYSRKLFEFDEISDFARQLLPDDMGFAGFEVMNSSAQQGDWLAFLGASYFRSPGEAGDYGLSARGIAINTGLSIPEEFPRFTSFWLESAADPRAVVTYTLLDGPSITGAYRIEATRQAYVVMRIEAVLFARTAISRMGVAPMTSMFWFSETNHWVARDWRPEVHDSDGLALWKGNGERLWRPLNNPPSVQTQSFLDNSPKGFGLLQRDRNFENYQDDNVFYERRPSLWVEPLEPWGEGAVQLVELPTASEFNDNIVAYWVPKAPVQAGSTWNFNYRLHWLADEPCPPALGQVIATRLKLINIPNKPYAANKVWLFIDFGGGPLEHLEQDAPVKLVVHNTQGRLTGSSARQLVGTKYWRGTLDIELKSSAPVDIRAYLQLGDQALTEIWLYQFIPRISSS